MREPILEGVKLSLGYQKPLLEMEISPQLHRGELVCLLGPNGAGKTTLLKTLTGLLSPLGGKIKLRGQELASVTLKQRAKQLALVLTERGQTGFLTVRDLTALGRHPYTGALGALARSDWAEVERAMQQAEVDELADLQVCQLSDGQKQRAFIARALAQEPSVLALDEPTAFLDLPHRFRLMSLLQTLAGEQNCALLLSTHELDLALKYADRLWLMGIDGSFHEGTPEDLGMAGVLDQVFGLPWDPVQCSFTRPPRSRGCLAISAPQPQAVWAERTAQRMGWLVDPNSPNRLTWNERGWELWGETGPDFAWVASQLKTNFSGSVGSLPEVRP